MNLTAFKQFVGNLALITLGVGSLTGANAAELAVPLPIPTGGTFTLDFDGLPVGQRVWEATLEGGMSGSGVGAAIQNALGTSSVHIHGQRPDRVGDSNRAMTFDGECGGEPEGCSGNDPDLYQPGQGNLLIVSQDNNTDNPNDNHEGGHIDFDFGNFGPGAVTVTSIKVFDVSHGGAAVYLYADGKLLEKVALPRGGTGEGRTVELNVPEVDFMRVVVNDSFAVDDLVFEVP